MKDLLEYLYTEVQCRRLSKKDAVDLICQFQNRIVSNKSAILHPLLHQNTSGLSGQRFSSVFTGEEFFLADHIFKGQRVLPGVTCLEMARAAVEAATNPVIPGAAPTGILEEDWNGIRLKNVVWARPIILRNQPTPIHIRLFPEESAFCRDGEIAYEIYGSSCPDNGSEPGDAGLIIYNQGNIQFIKALEMPALDLQFLQTQCARAILSSNEVYEAFKAIGLEYNPVYQGIETVYVGQDQVLAKLSLPSSVSEIADRFMLHPIILESALAAVGFMMSYGHLQPLLPEALQELEIFNRCVPTMWALIRYSNVMPVEGVEPGGHGPKINQLLQFDIDLCDEQGIICIRMQGYSAREWGGELAGKNNPSKVVEMPGMLMFKAGWNERPVTPEVSLPDYVEHLVVLGELTGPDGDKICPENIESQMNGVRCLSLQSDRKGIDQRFQNYATQVFEEIQGILGGQSGGRTLIQLVVPNGGEARLCSGIAGLLKTARLENPKIIGQLIEVEPGEDTAGIMAKLKANRKCPDDNHIRYQDGKRWVFDWSEIEISSWEPSIPWKDGGIYLITGGAGGLGWIFAAEIADQVKGSTIILAGRSELSDEKQSKLRELKRTGAGVIYRTMDVTDAKQVKELIQSIREEFGRLDGIIHGAGVIHDNFIIHKTKEEWQEVLAPKVSGMVNLDLASKDLKLDFFILFSSISGSSGNVGQADYATANAFMDAYASYRNRLAGLNQRHGRTLAMIWPLWKEGGMHVSRETEMLIAQNTGMIAMQTRSGIQALYRAFGSGRDQALVMEGEPSKMREYLLGTAAKAQLQPSQAVNPRVDQEQLREKTLHQLKKLFGEVTKLTVAGIDIEEPLESYGIDSFMIIQLNAKLAGIFGELSKTIFYEYQTLGTLGEYLSTEYPRECMKWSGFDGQVQSRPETVPAAVAIDYEFPELASWKIRKKRTHNISFTASGKETREPIAIIGISGRYPQARTLEEYWRNLAAGKDCIIEIPKERWPLEGFYHPDPAEAVAQGKSYCKWGGFIEGFAEFDPLFFNISPREALNMDPQERLFIQICWEVLEDAGYTREQLAAQYQGRVGVFAGITKTGFSLYGPDLWKQGEQVFPYTSFSSVANRVSYLLNLQGPSMPIDTMCSSSLTAIHEACEHLLRGECDMAIAGGVNLYLHPSSYIGLCGQQMLSRDGKCKSFGKGGDGFVPGEGVGTVLLKPLSRAVADQDHIYAIIRGTSINHGGKTNGYTVPNPNAQGELIRLALEKSGVDARTVSYIEAHGTGTELGDPIEITGLTQGFRRACSGAKDTGDTGYCAIGSVKSNIGHLEAAAGIAGLTKIVLQMRYGRIVPSLHATELNPNINFAKTPFVVQQELAEWKRLVVTTGGITAEYPRIAGISSFGAGGANAHVVIEEYMPGNQEQRSMMMNNPAAPAALTVPTIIVLSAKNEERLREQAGRILDVIKEQQFSGDDLANSQLAGSCLADSYLADMAYTLQVGREAMEERLGLIVNSIRELEEKLKGFIEAQDGIPGLYRGQVKPNQETLGILAADEEMQEMVDKWLQRRKYGRLLDLWVKGLAIDWNKLYGDIKPRRISLPAYPFAKESYWIPGHVSMSETGHNSSRQLSRLEKEITPPDELMYLPVWEAQPPENAVGPDAPRTVLIVYSGLSAKFEKTIQDYYRKRKITGNVIQVQLGNQTKPVSGRKWQCDINDPKGMETCLQDYDSIDCLFFIAECPEEIPAMDPDTLLQSQQNNEIQLLRLIKFLSQRDSNNRPIDCFIITRDNYRITGTGVDPRGGGITGLAYAIAQGDYRFSVRNIDIASEDLITPEKREALLQLILTAKPSDRGEVIKFQNGGRYRQVFLTLDLSRVKQGPGFRKGGVYVVLGGSGTVGMVITRYLIQRYNAKIIWIGRKQETSEAIREKMASLRVLGEPLLYIQSDVTRYDQITEAVASIKRQCPAIHGAIFAGLVITFENSVKKTTENEFLDIMNIKTLGSLNFYNAFQDEPLDFMCYFSSAQAFSFSGAANLSAYASGITYADSLARFIRESSRFPVGIINWGFWKSSLQGTQAGFTDQNLGTLEDREGIDCFEHFTRLLREGVLHQAICLRASKPVRELMKWNAEEIVSIHEKSSGSMNESLMIQSLGNDKTGMEHQLATPVMDTAPELDSWAVKLLLAQLRRLGILLPGNNPEEITALRNRAGIIDKYDRWFKECLSILETGGHIEIEDGRENGSRVGVLQNQGLESAETVWRDWESAQETFINDQERQQFKLVETCLRELPEILRGQVPATDILFPGSSVELVAEVYQGNTVADYFNTLAADIVAKYAGQRLAAGAQAKIRIIEAGAGTGATSTKMFEKLKSFAGHIEYCYTDISKAFLRFAKENYGPENPYLVYKLWNIEKPLADQGIEAGGYDIVIATNVLHATRNIRRTLRNVKAALAMNGILLINEVIRKSIFGTITFGLLDGWWLYEDEWLRIPGSPVLYPDTWRKVLGEEGFREIQFPAEAAHLLGQQVIIAESDGMARQIVESRLLPTEAAKIAEDPINAARYSGMNQKESNQIPGLATRETAVTALQVPVEPQLPDKNIEEYVKARILDDLSQSVMIPGDRINCNVAFSDYGVDSIIGVSFVKQLNGVLGVNMNSAVLFDYTTVNRLTDFIVKTYKEQLRKQAAMSSNPVPRQPVVTGIERLFAPDYQNAENPGDGSLNKAYNQRLPEAGPEKIPVRSQFAEIAVIGMAGQFPGASDVNAFWDHLTGGYDAIHRHPAPDFDQDRNNGDNSQPNPGGAFLEARDCFDPLFFNISPREAGAMNPHQRLILQESWKALEDAGYNPRNLANSPVGIFIGAEPSGYYYESFTGASDAIIASRLSYHLDLKGPAFVVNTGCSSSAVAIHLACESLRNEETSLAIAGGVNANLSKDGLAKLAETGILSPTGRCCSFDESADGIVLSEGVGVVVLKRLPDAVAARDHIYGILQSGINQDGTSNGITAPNGLAQEQLITGVYKRYGINPEDITYVEAHGTGAKFGDPVEANALVRAFKQFTNQKQYCVIGTAKPFIGHTGAASGVIGLIKVLLSMRHHKIPGLIHFRELNSLIDLKESAFYVSTDTLEWKPENNKPLTAALNSFGHSGTNVHMVIKEYIPPDKELPPTQSLFSGNSPAIIPLSARNPERLREYAGKLVEFLKNTGYQNTTIDLAALAYTLQTGREAMEERVVFLVKDIPELISKMEAFWEGVAETGNCWRGRVNSGPNTVRPYGPDDDMREMANQCPAQSTVEKIAELWVQGSAIDWESLFYKEVVRGPRRMSLPAYPFARERYWVSPKHGENYPVNIRRPAGENPEFKINPETTILENLQNYLIQFLVRALDVLPDPIDLNKDFREYGLNSIFIMKLMSGIEAIFQIRVLGREMLEHPAIASLAAYLAGKITVQGRHENIQNADTAFEKRNSGLNPQDSDGEAEILEKFKAGIISFEEVQELL
jgi:acyl transferase domain-containing protein/acyl carrier protein/SAM-dependent methyltransferase